MFARFGLTVTSSKSGFKPFGRVNALQVNNKFPIFRQNVLSKVFNFQDGKFFCFVFFPLDLFTNSTFLPSFYLYLLLFEFILIHYLSLPENKNNDNNNNDVDNKS